jgi:hypothetical protein
MVPYVLLAASSRINIKAAAMFKVCLYQQQKRGGPDSGVGIHMLTNAKLLFAKTSASSGRLNQ